MSTNTLNKSAENEAFAWLARVNSSQFSELQEREFMRWLESSPRHQAAYIKAEQLWERGALLQKVSVPEKNSAHIFSEWQVSFKQAAFTCSFMLVMLVGLWSYLNKTSEFIYQTAMAEVKEIQLDDGSHISLNTNSQLKIELNRKKRTAYLTKGEVFFDVKKDGRPFEVITQSGVVRVVGTRFSVYQLATDAMVTVAEGRVALGKLTTQNTPFEPAVILQTNQRLSLQNAQLGKSPETLNANAALAWRKKQLVFKGEKLSQVIAELGRYFSDTIVLREPELANREITAVIQITDLTSTLKMLSQSLQLQVELDSSQHRAELFSQPPSSQKP